METTEVVDGNAAGQRVSIGRKEPTAHAPKKKTRIISSVGGDPHQRTGRKNRTKGNQKEGGSEQLHKS